MLKTLQHVFWSFNCWTEIPEHTPHCAISKAIQRFVSEFTSKFRNTRGKGRSETQLRLGTAGNMTQMWHLISVFNWVKMRPSDKHRCSVEHSLEIHRLRTQQLHSSCQQWLALSLNEKQFKPQCLSWVTKVYVEVCVHGSTGRSVPHVYCAVFRKDLCITSSLQSSFKLLLPWCADCLMFATLNVIEEEVVGNTCHSKAFKKILFLHSVR